MSLANCIPSHKSDLAAAHRAAEQGYPAINAILPSLLEWLKDGNWPVSAPLASLLAEAGPEIAPAIQAALQSDDDLWKYWILTMLGPQLSERVWHLIEPDVARLSQRPTSGEMAEEVDVEAHQLLALRSGANA